MHINRFQYLLTETLLRVHYWMVICFPTSSNQCLSTTWENTEMQKLSLLNGVLMVCQSSHFCQKLSKSVNAPQPSTWTFLRHSVLYVSCRQETEKQIEEKDTNSSKHIWLQLRQLCNKWCALPQARTSMRQSKGIEFYTFCGDCINIKVHTIQGKPTIIWLKMKANTEFIVHNYLRQNSILLVQIHYLQICSEALNTRHNKMLIIPI